MAADGQLDNGYIHGVTHRESDIFKAYCKGKLTAWPLIRLC